MNNNGSTPSEYEDIIKQAISLREKSCFSQRQVASVIGLRSHSNINAYETLKVVPKLDTFLKILSVYGYTIKLVPSEDTDSDDQLGHRSGK